jgi:hypothetical protein
MTEVYWCRECQQWVRFMPGAPELSRWVPRASIGRVPYRRPYVIVVCSPCWRGLYSMTSGPRI